MACATSSQALATTPILCLRLGIGHPGNAKQVADFVLKRAPTAEAELTQTASDKALAVREDLFSGQWDKALRTLHSAS